MNKVYLSLNAQNDMAEIKSYISTELKNPMAASRIVARITKNIRILKTHAAAGARLSSITSIDSDYRFLITGNYMTFYHVRGSDVYVDRVLYGRRDYLRILFGNMQDETDE